MRLILCRCSVFLISYVAYAQLPVGFGIKGGFGLTDSYGIPPNIFGLRSDGKDYILGASAELRLLLGFAVEADGLYRPVNLTSLAQIGSSTTGRRTTWEFPVLAKYRFPTPILKPFIEAGPSFRAHASGAPDLTSHGFAVGGGVELKPPVIRLSAEIRYTRWAAPNGTITTSPNDNQAEVLFGLSF